MAGPKQTTTLLAEYMNSKQHNSNKNINGVISKPSWSLQQLQSMPSRPCLEKRLDPVVIMMARLQFPFSARIWRLTCVQGHLRLWPKDAQAPRNPATDSTALLWQELFMSQKQASYQHSQQLSSIQLNINPIDWIISNLQAFSRT